MKTHSRLQILCTAFLLCTSMNLWAQPDDIGTWTSLTLKKNWKAITGDVRIEHRSEQNATALDCWFIRPNISYKLTDWFRTEGCYYYIRKTSSSSHRTLLGFTTMVHSGALSCSLTERWQYNYVIETGASSHVIRSKFNTAFQIEDTPFHPYIATEIFTATHWNESRHYLGCTIKRQDINHSMDIFYEYRLRSNHSTQEHIIGIGYSLSL